jgi:hypothetical protein
MVHWSNCALSRNREPTLLKDMLEKRKATRTCSSVSWTRSVASPQPKQALGGAS